MEGEELQTLFQKVLNSDTGKEEFEAIEELRGSLIQSKKQIELTDFGAGSKDGKKRIKTIGQIARMASSRSFQCRTLHHLVGALRPKTMLEMGTSLGLATIYQGLPKVHNKFITLEGDPKIAQIAKENIAKFGVENVEIRTGEFATTLDEALDDLSSLDYAFIDGNHRYEPTLAYFEKCLEYSCSNSVLIFDDIYWSKEMKAAWNEIKGHSRVSSTVDLFFMGIVFLKEKPKSKRHYSIISKKHKPWA